MNSVGIDLHRNRSQIAVIDEQRRAVAVAADRQRPRRRSCELLGDLGGRDAGRARGDLRLGVAGGAARGRRLRAAPRAPAAHPGDRRGAGEDRRGRRASTLAHLLRADLLPEAYIAPRELRDLRELLRHRVALTADALGAQEPRARDPRQARHHAASTPTCSAKAAASSSPSSQLREAPRRRLDSLLALIDDFDREIDATSQRDRRSAPRPTTASRC